MQSESYAEQNSTLIVHRPPSAGAEPRDVLRGDPIAAVEQDVLRRTFIDAGILVFRGLGASRFSGFPLQ